MAVRAGGVVSGVNYASSPVYSALPSGAFSVLTSTVGPVQPGDSIAFTTQNAADALTVTDDKGNAITLDNSAANSGDFTCPDPTTFGTHATYSPDAAGTMGNFGSRTFTVSDGTDSDTFTITINPPTGYNWNLIESVGFLLTAYTGIEVDVDYLYGLVESGNTTVDWTNGNVEQGSEETTAKIKIYDVSLSDWTTEDTHIIPGLLVAAIISHIFRMRRAS